VTIDLTYTSINLIAIQIIVLFLILLYIVVNLRKEEWPTEGLQVVYGTSPKFRNLVSEIIHEYYVFVNNRIPC